ncbi:MAG: hypothetical protein EBR82_33790 [Caulobacteraceae bacterium]|nr:hypothetical protein [Caulobacteraceae bacterium]
MSKTAEELVGYFPKSPLEIVKNAGWQLFFDKTESDYCDEGYEIWRATHKETGRIVKFSAFTDKDETGLTLIASVFIEVIEEDTL